MEQQNQIQEIVEAAILNLRQVAEVNTIIGQPILTSMGATILPVSQVTLGFVAGGGEYAVSGAQAGAYGLPFAGGAGAGVSIHPMGFLVCGRNGVRLFKMVKLCEQSNLEKIVDVTKDIVERFVKN